MLGTDQVEPLLGVVTSSSPRCTLAAARRPDSRCFASALSLAFAFFVTMLAVILFAHQYRRCRSSERPC